MDGRLDGFYSQGKKGSPAYILVVQDVFSRFIFAKALESKAEVTAAFSRIIEETGRKCEEFQSDRGTEFVSAAFQARLKNMGIRHRLKVGPQDLGTLDRAIGTMRATLSRRTAEGGPWWEELDAAVKSMNNSEHAALFMQEPAEVQDDPDLRFDLRYKNAEMAEENQELAKKRAARLEDKGAFRTLLPPKTGFRRRAGQQNWSEKVHYFKAIEGAHVVDSDGNSFPMSTVLPVPLRTAASAPSTLAQAGSERVDEKRRIALRPWLQDLIDTTRRAGDEGITTHRLGRTMASKPGFTNALKEQRASIAQAVTLFPELRVERRRGHTIVFVAAGAPLPRAGTLDTFAQ